IRGCWSGTWRRNISGLPGASLDGQSLELLRCGSADCLELYFDPGWKLIGIAGRSRRIGRGYSSRISRAKLKVPNIRRNIILAVAVRVSSSDIAASVRTRRCLGNSIQRRGTVLRTVENGRADWKRFRDQRVR